MKDSKMQTIVWDARKKLAKELAGMASEEICRYAEQIVDDFLADRGRRPWTKLRQLLSEGPKPGPSKRKHRACGHKPKASLQHARQRSPA